LFFNPPHPASIKSIKSKTIAAFVKKLIKELANPVAAFEIVAKGMMSVNLTSSILIPEDFAVVLTKSSMLFIIPRNLVSYFGRDSATDDALEYIRRDMRKITMANVNTTDKRDTAVGTFFDFKYLIIGSNIIESKTATMKGKRTDSSDISVTPSKKTTINASNIIVILFLFMMFGFDYFY
jgi:hypothetical protein